MVVDFEASLHEYDFYALEERLGTTKFLLFMI